MTSEGLGEVFKGDSAVMFCRKFPLVSMGGRANGQACTDGERGPSSAQPTIIEEVRRTSWWSVHYCEDANEVVEIFTNKLSEILDRHAPLKTIQTRSNFALSSKRKEDWSSYKMLRNKVTKNKN
jgi:hypothetical protein